MSYKNFYNLGKEKEKVFAECCEANEIKARKASKDDDVRRHIDFFLEKDGKEIGVDFKGAKKKNRGDDRPDWNLVWIEIKNVAGNKGWLHGDAEFIVFEQEFDYLFIPRCRLIEFTEKYVDLTVSSKKQKQVCYQRKGRKDLIYWTTISDILIKFPFVEFYRLRKINENL